jgi:hypothetical protein
MAAPVRTQVNLITNNFKIKSKNSGVIYTYKVDFLEGAGCGSGGSGGADSKSFTSDDQINSSMSSMSLGIGNKGGLETFQKFKIMNAHKDQIKKIFT